MGNHVFERLIPLREVSHLAGISGREVYRRIRESNAPRQFPAPVKLGRISRWRLSEVQDWIARQGPVASSANGHGHRA